MFEPVFSFGYPAFLLPRRRSGKQLNITILWIRNTLFLFIKSNVDPHALFHNKVLK